jgi:hypothetical protein
VPPKWCCQIRLKNTQDDLRDFYNPEQNLVGVFVIQQAQTRRVYREFVDSNAEVVGALLQNGVCKRHIDLVA